MNVHRAVHGMMLAAMIGLAWLVVSSPPAAAQPDDPTDAQATVNALVQSYFDQTATAAPQIVQTQTLEAAFASAQTATASFDATVQSAFNQAATATQRAIAPLPTRVVSTQEINLNAGMLGQNAFLAPNGERFVHLNTDEICIYTIESILERCIDVTDKISTIDIERFRWSADSRYLAFTEDFIITFNEPDLWIIDTETGELTNITDDQVSGSMLLPSGIASTDLDFAPEWLDDGRVAFLRSNRTDGGSSEAVFVIQPDGSGLESLVTLPVDEGFPVYDFDISPDGRFLAYNWGPATDDARNGLWLLDLQTGDERQLFQASNPAQVPDMVSFSPDGQYILWVDQVHRMRLPNRNAESSPVRIVPVAGGDPMLVSDDLLVFLAWWSPNDYALAYLVHDLQDTSASGMYIASAPGEAGQKVLEGMFLPPNGRMSVPVMWAMNDVILLSLAPDDGMIAVQLGS